MERDLVSLKKNYKKSKSSKKHFKVTNTFKNQFRSLTRLQMEAAKTDKREHQLLFTSSNVYSPRRARFHYQKQFSQPKCVACHVLQYISLTSTYKTQKKIKGPSAYGASCLSLRHLLPEKVATALFNTCAPRGSKEHLQQGVNVTYFQDFFPVLLIKEFLTAACQS